MRRKVCLGVLGLSICLFLGMGEGVKVEATENEEVSALQVLIEENMAEIENTEEDATDNDER